MRTRNLPIMLIILPTMLCCTTQNFAYYAQITSQYLTIINPLRTKNCVHSLP